MLEFLRKSPLLRRILCLCLVLTMAGTMCSCNLIDKFLASLLIPQRRTIPFSEMTYTRPDFESFQSTAETLTKQIQENKISYKRQLSDIKDLTRKYWSYRTMYSLCYIHYALDNTNAFYTEEYAFFGETNPKLQYAMEDLFVACAKSKHKKRFESDYFGVGYLDTYLGGGQYSPELVTLMQQEAQLIQSYNQEAAKGTVLYLGQERPLSQLLAQAATKSEHQNILKAYKQQTNKTLGEIYVDLVKVRLQITELLGYNTYAEYAYKQTNRDYTAQAGAAFVSQVEQHLVPLFKTLNEKDIYYPTLSRLNTEDILPIAGKALSAMDDSIQEVYRFLQEYDLYNITPSDNKINQEFTTYIENYDAPFMIINPQGESSDLLSFAHEFGHFTDMYANYNTNFSLDLSECASMGMEYLFVSYLPQDKKSLQEELEAHKMYSTLYVHVVQSAYTAFEQAVYQLPKEEVTLTKINGIAKDVTNRFDLHEEDFGLTWTWIPHFYEQAFYCISYCFSNDIAFQLYQEECAQAGNGVSLYIDLIQWNPDQTFLENIRRVGLVDPCDESRITAMRDFLTDYYEDTQLQSAA